MHRIGITGHRQFDEPTSRLIREALHRVIAAYQSHDLVGVTCLAEGSDTLFAEAVAGRGGRLEVVVPALRYREALPRSHRHAYDEFLARADRPHRLPLIESDDAAYLAGSHRMLTIIDQLVAVWDGLPARGVGDGRGRRGCAATRLARRRSMARWRAAGDRG